MVDFYQFLIFCSLVVISICDVCYYDDGTHFGQTTLCAGTCCRTGNDPCCIDTGSIIAIAIGAVVSILLLMVCALICCAQRAHANRERLNRERRLHQRLSELHVVTNNNVEVPPRYSDLYPHQSVSGSSNMGSARSSFSFSQGSRRSLFGSFRREGSSRRSTRHNRQSEQVTHEQNITPSGNQNRQNGSTKTDNPFQPTHTGEQNYSNTYDDSTNQFPLTTGLNNSDQSRVATLPVVIESTRM